MQIVVFQVRGDMRETNAISIISAMYGKIATVLCPGHSLNATFRRGHSYKTTLQPRLYLIGDDTLHV